MKLKSLIEKHNSKLDEIDALLEVGVSETRSLTEEETSKIEELKIEAEKLAEEIRSLENEASEDAVAVEETNEKRSSDNMEMTKELEIRGIEQYLRREEGEELRAMTAGANSSLVPTYLHDEVVKALPEVAPLFSLVPKFTPVSGTLRIAAEDNLGNAGFVGETTPLTPNDATFRTVELKQVRAGSAIEIHQHLINDAGIDIVDYSQRLLFRRLGYAIDRAMITGNETNNNIQGLARMKEDPNKATCRVMAKTQDVIEIEDLLVMASDMEAVYQSGAKWIMDRGSFQEVFKLTDGNGRPFMVREVVGDTITYKILGMEVLINDAAQNIYLVNFEHAYAGMIKKDVSLKTIDSDRQSALAGTTTLVLDAYIDAKIVKPKAIRYLAVTDADRR